jgi:hypothetical protein
MDRPNSIYISFLKIKFKNPKKYLCSKPFGMRFSGMGCVFTLLILKV